MYSDATHSDFFILYFYSCLATLTIDSREKKTKNVIFSEKNRFMEVNNIFAVLMYFYFTKIN